jgi:hypothetical protein
LLHSPKLLRGNVPLKLVFYTEPIQHTSHRNWGRREVFIVFWLGGLKGRDHWGDLGVGGRITLRWTLGRGGSMGGTGFGWLRIGSGGGLL